MCSPVKCRSCGKTTWSGCGRHVEQVMGGVPKAKQCTCDRAAARPPLSSSGVFASLFGRKRDEG